VPVLFTIAGALSDPLGFVIAPLASGHAPSVDGRVFALTFGLPSIFSEDLSCLSFLLLPPALLALSLLRLLSRRSFGSCSFWITVISIGYSAFLFGGADVADISGSDGIWVVVWILAGAIIGFLVKLGQTVVKYRAPMQDNWPAAGVTLGWVMAGAVSAMVGLFLGMLPAGDWLASHQPTFKDSLPIILAAISSGLILTAIVGLLAGLTFGPASKPTPSGLLPPNEPVQAPGSG